MCREVLRFASAEQRAPSTIPLHIPAIWHSRFSERCFGSHFPQRAFIVPNPPLQPTSPSTAFGEPARFSGQGLIRPSPGRRSLQDLLRRRDRQTEEQMKQATLDHRFQYNVGPALNPTPGELETEL
jgi:hypothetical protein